MDLAEGGSAGLLVDGHGIAAEQGIDKGGLSCIEVAGDEDLGRGVLDTEAEIVDVGDGSSDAVCEEAFDRGLFELVDESEGRGGAKAEVEFENVEGVLWVAVDVARVAEVFEEGLCAVCSVEQACKM